MTNPNVTVHRRSRITGPIDPWALSGVWYLAGAVSPADCLAAYVAKGAADAAASYINAALPGTYNLANGTAYPSWSVTDGWIFLATSSQYLSISGMTAQALKPCTVIARIVPGGTGYRDFIGGAAPGNCLCIRVTNTNYIEALDQSTESLGTSSSTVSGDTVVAFSYSNVGAFAFYKAGAADGTGTNNNTLTARQMYIGRAATEYFNGNILALAIYSAVLTADQVAAVSAAMAAM